MRESRATDGGRDGGGSAKRLSYANVTATLALVIALGGGSALAARHYLITSKHQISPPVLRALRGASGPAGPSGLDGRNGTPGAAGSAGATGLAGPMGATGPTGPGTPTGYGQVAANGTLAFVQPTGAVTIAKIGTGVYCIDVGNVGLVDFLVATPLYPDDANTTIQTVASPGDACDTAFHGLLEVVTLNSGVQTNEAFNFFLPQLIG